MGFLGSWWSVKSDLTDKAEPKIGQGIALLQRRVGGESLRQWRTPSPIGELKALCASPLSIMEMLTSDSWLLSPDFCL
ncbi:MAG: hypothetical protein DRP97_00405 [Candidatus Latescibacterota bacterium]|nr:MAG: hypothetical protein DRP97_00405 [Candidatus Latescibacterota bacterium]